MFRSKTLTGAIGLLLLLTLGLLPSQALAELSVVATTTDLGSMAEQLGGEHVSVYTLTRPLEDAHYLDATPGMITRTSYADVFIQNGMELEVGWIPEVLRQTRNRDVRPGGPGYVDASRGIQAIQVPDEMDRAQGDVHKDGNPHYTLDPIEAQQAARNIVEALEAQDPENAEVYRENLEEFIEEAEELVEQYQEKFEPHRGTELIIYHEHFDYMLQRLGIEVTDSIEPLPGVAPSARHIAGLIDSYSGDENVKMVIMEPWHNERMARQVAEGIDVPLLQLCPAVGCEDTANIFELFEHNADQMLQVLEE